jgi:hypothetical protein
MHALPVGTAYAVWVGIGAALTAGYAMWSGAEPTSLLRVLLLVGVACVIGLKVTHEERCTAECDLPWPRLSDGRTGMSVLEGVQK